MVAVNHDDRFLHQPTGAGGRRCIDKGLGTETGYHRRFLRCPGKCGDGVSSADQDSNGVAAYGTSSASNDDFHFRSDPLAINVGACTSLQACPPEAVVLMVDVVGLVLVDEHAEISQITSQSRAPAERPPHDDALLLATCLAWRRSSGEAQLE
jgi:hypothetical protein